MFGKFKKKVEGWAMGKIVAIALKKAGEGDFGPKVKALYWKMAGAKTLIAVILAIAWYSLTQLGGAGYCADCSTWASYVGGAAAFLATVGLVDAGVRIEPPKESK